MFPDVTGFPEMMDGRIKTLHPKIHGALLGLRDKRRTRRSDAANMGLNQSTWS